MGELLVAILAFCGAFVGGLLCNRVEIKVKPRRKKPLPVVTKLQPKGTPKVVSMDDETLWEMEKQQNADK